MSQPSESASLQVRVRAVATQFRTALEQRELTSVWNDSFPCGSCGGVSDLLGQYLTDSGLGLWRYASGGSSRGPHAWLVLDDLYLDITADQFDDVEEPVILTTDGSWHGRWAGGPQGIAGLQRTGGPRTLDLRAHYKVLRARMTSP